MMMRGLSFACRPFRLKVRIVLGAAIALSTPAAALSSTSPSREDRVAAVAYRLGSAALPWCDRRVRLAGWQLQYLDDFDAALRHDVAAAFALDRGPNIVAVVPGSPAAQAGLRSSDTLLSVDGELIPPTRSTGEAMLATLKTAPVRLHIWRNGATSDVTLRTTAGCPATVRLVPVAARNAFADGSAVIASTHIVDLAHDDAELAALLGHEYAHNYLHHGVGDDAAASPAAIQREESAADRLGLMLMAAAGYDLDAAPRFWGRLLRDTRRIAAGAGTHAPRRERLQAMRQEIARLKHEPHPGWSKDGFITPQN